MPPPSPLLSAELPANVTIEIAIVPALTMPPPSVAVLE